MPIAALDRALRAVGVGGREGGADVLEPDAIFEQGRRVELGPHRRKRTAADRDLADPIDLGQLLRQHGRRGIVKFALPQGIGGQRQDEDWGVGRIDLSVGRVRTQARGQVGPCRVDGRLHVARGAVDVAIETKLQRDAGRADGALRSHFRDVRNLAEMAFQRRRDAGGDHLGTGARKLCPYRDGRKIDLRQRRYRKLEERHGAGCSDPEGEKDRGDGPPDEHRRRAHSAGLPALRSRTSSSILKYRLCSRSNQR